MHKIVSQENDGSPLTVKYIIFQPRPVHIGAKKKFKLNLNLNLLCKGGAISESFSHWLKSLKKGTKNYPGHYPPKEKMLRIVIWHLFLQHLSQCEKLSEIKAPLNGSINFGLVLFLY